MKTCKQHLTEFSIEDGCYYCNVIDKLLKNKNHEKFKFYHESDCNCIRCSPPSHIVKVQIAGIRLLVCLKIFIKKFLIFTKLTR